MNFSFLNNIYLGMLRNMGNKSSQREKVGSQEENKEPSPEAVQTLVTKEQRVRELEFEAEEKRAKLNLHIQELVRRKELELQISQIDQGLATQIAQITQEEDTNELDLTQKLTVQLADSMVPGALSTIKPQTLTNNNMLKESPTDQNELLQLANTEVSISAREQESMTWTEQLQYVDSEIIQSAIQPSTIENREIEIPTPLMKPEPLPENGVTMMTEHEIPIWKESLPLVNTEVKNLPQLPFNLRPKNERLGRDWLGDISNIEDTNSTDELQPLMTDNQPKENEIRPSVTGIKAKENELRPSVTDNKAKENELQPLVTENEAKERTTGQLPSPGSNYEIPQLSKTVTENKHREPIQSMLLDDTGVTNSSNGLQPLVPENKVIEKTSTWRTPVLINLTPTPPSHQLTKTSRTAKRVKENNHRKLIQQKVSTPPADTIITSVKQQMNRDVNQCEPSEELQTPEDKKMYQCTALEQLKQCQRPGSSVVLLEQFTSRLQGYIDCLKIIDPQFMHSPMIMKVVCAKLEPYILSSWCEYAAKFARGKKPIILTMLAFLHQKVDIGYRYWHKYSKEATKSASRKRKHSGFSNANY